MYYWYREESEWVRISLCVRLIRGMKLSAFWYQGVLTFSPYGYFFYFTQFVIAFITRYSLHRGAKIASICVKSIEKHLTLAKFQHALIHFFI